MLSNFEPRAPCLLNPKFGLDYCSVFGDLHYIMHEAADEKHFWNGVRDEGRSGRRLADFMALQQALKAQLTEAELVALRFYISHSSGALVTPLRSTSYVGPHPLPGIVVNIQKGLKKLRALGSDDVSSKHAVVLWRGMRDRKLSDDFTVHEELMSRPCQRPRTSALLSSIALIRQWRLIHCCCYALSLGTT